MKNLSIRGKLLLTFAGLAFVVLLVSLLSVRSLASANGRFTDHVKGIGNRAALASHVRTAVDRRAIAARNLVLVSQPRDRDMERALVLAAHADVGRYLSALKTATAQAGHADATALDLVARIDKVEQSYGPVALDIVDLALRGKKEEAIVKMNDECRPLLAALSQATEDFAKFTAAHEARLVQEAESAYELQRDVLIAASLVAVIAAAAAGWLVTQSITQSMAQAVKVAEAVADGDLTVKVSLARTDEVGKLFRALSRMNVSLTEIVARVRMNSEGIATASTQIATGSADLSLRTEQQASSLQQTASTMDQLSSTVRHTAANASQADQLAVDARAVADEGGAVVAQVVDTMRHINDSSQRIAEIISVIDSIAFQTNILALNAAVEAARAGEHGRGFAVVAEEVRTLARRSGEAAKEIEGLISRSVEHVGQGSKLVELAGQTMQSIVSSVKGVSDIVREISTASAEQSVGVSQVGGSISNLDQVTQQNAALVQQSAVAAESLRQRAGGLVEAVSVFKILPQA
ncbi:methyl-accepting chemotaxis protein [Roseateles aquatilis]|uniref:Methyl-accepting chemotaxis protein n=1 Tax=Roseateles aquatilis TaxID=431061 RepID=A0A246J2X2_9BURK|nr:methyl-accepting chemotaxis protein [Roseateles aquatilis]OWQ86913.1 methyl-accepting chemotaxis protein [Roseateles aquatilis]